MWSNAPRQGPPQGILLKSLNTCNGTEDLGDKRKHVKHKSCSLLSINPVTKGINWCCFKEVNHKTACIRSNKAIQDQGEDPKGTLLITLKSNPILWSLCYDRNKF